MDARQPGAGDPRSRLVRDLFRGTASSYDEVVERATLGLDSRWKRLLLERMEAPRRVLDLASGTGILSVAIARRFPETTVVGVELQEEYVREATAKVEGLGLCDRVRFVVGRAEEAEVEGPFDHAVSSYLAKYADLARLAPRVHALLAEGGLALFHDFAYPTDERAVRVWKETFAANLEAAVEGDPRWVRMFQGLPGVVRASTWTVDLVREMERCGFREVTAEDWSMGCAALVSGRK